MVLKSFGVQALSQEQGRTRLSGSEVKGTMRVLKKKYRHLSPAVGCALAHSPFLLNVYCYGTEQSATVQVWAANILWRAACYI
jgi:hypothetical protein